ncbi:hypothetical protein JTE90_023435 [Oedothorax gibbosus]|uniref:Uncharacterized protein n=1 Tax=Oedothorax gibbosus TaxID=931172 RepID=A0AAV6U1W8_9ARAC|nr:hypothetical protein JTE90_023435 [Oedothorax gibbosus]
MWTVVGPMEAAWRLNELPLHDRSHSAIRLPVYLDGQQYVTFQEGQEEAAVHKDCKTMLLGWFDLNKQDSSARQILYGDLPNSYSWGAKDKKWITRTRNAKVVGRLVSVSPRDSERFHLKLILNRMPGATCYQDLRVHENVIHKTFREAAIAMGITECSDEAIAVLEEAAKTMMPKQMRFLAYYLIGDEPMPGNCGSVLN